jgi:hypothetical protein
MGFPKYLKCSFHMIYYPSLCCDFIIREGGIKGLGSEMPEHIAMCSLFSGRCQCCWMNWYIMYRWPGWHGRLLDRTWCQYVTSWDRADGTSLTSAGCCGFGRHFSGFFLLPGSKTDIHILLLTMGSVRSETCWANYKIKNFPRRKFTFSWEIFTFITKMYGTTSIKHSKDCFLLQPLWLIKCSGITYWLYSNIQLRGWSFALYYGVSIPKRTSTRESGYPDGSFTSIYGQIAIKLSQGAFVAVQSDSWNNFPSVLSVRLHECNNPRTVKR